MRKIISILGMIVALGAIIFFLKPSTFEAERPPQKLPQNFEKMENFGTLNPLLSLAVQASEPKLMDSLNKVSVEVATKVRSAMVKVQKNKQGEEYSGILTLPNHHILTFAKGFTKNTSIDIILPTGIPAKALVVADHPASGITSLKLETETTIPAVETNDAVRVGEWLLIVAKDNFTNTNVLTWTTASGRKADQTIVFYTLQKMSQAFVFNSQGQLLGIAKSANGNMMEMIPISTMKALY